MTAPPLPRLLAAKDATWPAAATVGAGPWLLREGRGGGKRVSAATARGDWREDDLGPAEQAMRLMGQDPLFMIRPDDARLDRLLEAHGYTLLDPVQIRVCAVGRLTDRRLPPVTAFTIWEPLAIMREIWEAGGLDGARQAVMARVAPPRTALFGRVNDRPAGTAFCAIHDRIAMVHALEVLPAHRQKGLGGWMMRAAALWAARHGADWIAALVTVENRAAGALYASLGMEVAGGYHYRMLPRTEGTAP